MSNDKFYKLVHKETNEPYKSYKGKTFFSKIGHIKSSLIGKRHINLNNYELITYNVVEETRVNASEVI